MAEHVHTLQHHGLGKKTDQLAARHADTPVSRIPVVEITFGNPDDAERRIFLHAFQILQGAVR